ncbi:epoxide hydrolase [Ophiocordyceps sinensis CO18]|uniref:Epoxide hydrolase n=1 Tax=Ophiocordyceps sinensis (strain Co18 / CGMCC 3.14243) TaxID=911162 RepID=T5ACF4_OPHSC|nr:epoxide hydrolase [Ophiocordyceps sinensis CO18]
MASSKKPKVLLFDIGGVCVVSPFQAILDYELSLGVPPGWINYSISKSAPSGFWHRLERGEMPMDGAFLDGFNKDLHCPSRWRAFYQREQARNPSLPRELPPLPALDGAWLFDEMMSSSHAPDPWMYPALQNLKRSGEYMLGALSNTVIFPPGHKLHSAHFFDEPLRRLFDVFISSAHVGLRKPDPKMYELAVPTLHRFARDRADSERGRRLGWDAGIQAHDILFLDDIGENLREARAQGFGTIKVRLGRSYEAVEKLEQATGLKLEGNHPKIPVNPGVSEPKAKM